MKYRATDTHTSVAVKIIVLRITMKYRATDTHTSVAVKFSVLRITMKYRATDTHTSVAVKFSVLRIIMLEQIFLNKFSATARVCRNTARVSWD